MVARVEPVPIFKYQAYCDEGNREEHKHLGTFDTKKEAQVAADTHNETCKLYEMPKEVADPRYDPARRHENTEW